MATKDMVTIITYGQAEQMERKQAEKFMLDCMRHSEGSERDRYTNVYLKLLEGLTECSDEEY